jgi:hypothetical protein
MAVSLPTTLGTAASGSSASISLNTTAVAPSSSLIIVSVGCFLNTHAPSGLSCAGGSLAWTKVADKTGNVTTTDRYTAVFLAQAAGGVASATPISVTDAGGSDNNWNLAIAYVTGHVLGTVADTLDAAGAGNSGITTSGPGWSTGNVTSTVTDTLLWAVAHRDALTSSTTDAPFTEFQDFQNTNDNTTMTTAYQIVTSSGTYSATGSWAGGGSAEWVSTIIAIKAAGAGAGGSVTAGLRRFPLGV